jgi:hypothetical protein
MVKDEYSQENYNLLDGMKRYLRIEHKDDDKDLLDYLRKSQAIIKTDLFPFHVCFYFFLPSLVTMCLSYPSTEPKSFSLQ